MEEESSVLHVEDNSDCDETVDEIEKSDISEKTDNLLFERAETLLGNASSSFHELCKKLETEQAVLQDLEQRRKKLQEEMKVLRSEIEEEKRYFEADMTRVVRERITENSLPDPVDVTNFDIELKSEFMRDFLTQKSNELKAQMNNQTNENIEQDSDKTHNEDLLNHLENVLKEKDGAEAKDDNEVTN